MITDLHVDIIHDPDKRLNAFLDEMKKEEVDAIVQLGDFAIPKSENLNYIRAYNQAHSNAFHVLGNHDMDGGYSREEVVKEYGIPGKYYSTEVNGIQLLKEYVFALPELSVDATFSNPAVAIKEIKDRKNLVIILNSKKANFMADMRNSFLKFIKTPTSV